MKSLIRLLVLVLLLLVSKAFAVHAEEPAASGKAPLPQKLEKLRQMKEQDPEAFQRFVEQRKTAIKERVQQVRQQNPERFEQFQNKMKQRRRENFQKMQQQNPHELQQRMQGRMERFEQMKQKNPERFQQFSQKHPQLENRMRQMKEGNFRPPQRQENFQRPENGQMERQSGPGPQNRPQFQEKRPPFQGPGQSQNGTSQPSYQPPPQQFRGDSATADFKPQQGRERLRRENRMMPDARNNQREKQHQFLSGPLDRGSGGNASGAVPGNLRGPQGPGPRQGQGGPAGPRRDHDRNR